MSLRITSPTRNLALIALLSLGVLACGEEQRNAFFPPEGYYDPILEIETRKGKTNYSGELVNRFAGKYSISLAFERPTPVAQGYEFNEIDIRCTILTEGISSELPCGESLLHYWGDQSGVSVALYTVPDDVPKNIAVELRVAFRSVTELDELIEVHGKVRIVVKKWSDL